MTLDRDAEWVLTYMWANGTLAAVWRSLLPASDNPMWWRDHGLEPQRVVQLIETATAALNAQDSEATRASVGEYAEYVLGRTPALTEPLSLN